MESLELNREERESSEVSLRMLWCALNRKLAVLSLCPQQQQDLVADLNFDDLNITSQEDEILNEDEALEGWLETMCLMEVLSQSVATNHTHLHSSNIICRSLVVFHS